MALRISEDWDSCLKNSSAHTSTLQLQSHFRKQLQLLLQQLNVHSSSSPITVLDAIAPIIAALHALWEAQGRVSSPVVVVVPPVPNQPPGPRIATTSHPIENRKQERKYKKPICWRYAEKGHHTGPWKKRHISKDALALLPCPFFEKSAFCRFHETGQCWYGHGLPGADSQINLVSETPDLPQSNPDPPLTLTDFGTSRLLFVHSGTQTQFMLPKPVLKTRRFHSSTQTIPVLAVDVDTQTAPTLPMVDRETQTRHQNVIDLIEEEWEVQLEKREMHL